VRQITTIALLGCIASCTALAADTGGIFYSIGNHPGATAVLNREQLSSIRRGFSGDVGKPMRLNSEAAGVGILYLRGDGGDPEQVRIDDNPLIYITGETGAGRTYQHGREVDVNSAIKESARQIAMQQFRALGGAQVPIEELPAIAQAALTRFAVGGPAPAVMFARVASRGDTGRASEMMIAKLFSFKASLGAASPGDMVDLVKTAMLIFAIKSDACDKSGDPRCDQPGVRQAFAQIKREEAVQQMSSSR
jgi:hypothetical protein